MRLEDLPAVDFRETLVIQRGRLIDLLGSLHNGQWAAETAAPGWSVKDMSLHLLDVDMSWIARGRDGDYSGLIDVPSDHAQFVRGLAERNERWVTGTRSLSHKQIVDLLGWAGGQLTLYLETVDLDEPSSVYWAGDVPLWFDIAREFTERWVHGRQIREAALGRSGGGGGAEGVGPSGDEEFLGSVISTFVWALPHQYKVAASPGSTVAIDVAGVGGWTLTRTRAAGAAAGATGAATGSTGATADWTLEEGLTAEPDATLQMTADAAWRLFTGADFEPGQVQVSGRPELVEPLTKVRAIIV